MSYIGTELKINVTAEPMGDVHLADCDFECLFYVKSSLPISGAVIRSACNSCRPVVVRKDEMIKVNDDNFIARVDSADVGIGKLMMKITAHVPDPDFDDGLRTEIDNVWTGVTIKPAV